MNEAVIACPICGKHLDLPPFDVLLLTTRMERGDQDIYRCGFCATMYEVNLFDTGKVSVFTFRGWVRNAHIRFWGCII